MMDDLTPADLKCLADLLLLCRLKLHTITVGPTRSSTEEAQAFLDWASALDMDHEKFDRLYWTLTRMASGPEYEI